MAASPQEVSANHRGAYRRQARRVTTIPVSSYGQTPFTLAMWEKWRAELKPTARSLERRRGIEQLRSALWGRGCGEFERDPRALEKP